jgi:hypothetical protein
MAANPGRRDADNHRECAAAPDDAIGEGDGFAGTELGGLAHHTEDGESVHTTTAVELNHPVRRVIVEPTVLVEGRHANHVDACG